MNPRFNKEHFAECFTLMASNQPDNRPMCIYEALCGRANHLHWKQFCHPLAQCDTPVIHIRDYAIARTWY